MYLSAGVTAETMYVPKRIQMATVVCCRNWEDVDISNSLPKEYLMGVYTSQNSCSEPVAYTCMTRAHQKRHTRRT